jgi:hypothetical protein
VVASVVADNVNAALEAVNQLMSDATHPERRSLTGWPPANVGNVRARIAQDVRELRMTGYSWWEIHVALHGRRTLERC